MKTSRFYQYLLKLLPRHMRRNYGAEMEMVFSERLQERPGARPLLWIHETASMAQAGFRERVIDNLKLDLRAAWRLYARHPAFAVLAFVMLSVGIGGTTAMYSMLDAWVIDPLPYRDANRLIYMDSFDTKTGNEDLATATDFLDWQRNTSFQSMSAWSSAQFNLTAGDRPEQVYAMRVSSTFLTVLGIQPAEGRDFMAEEDSPGAPRVIILTRQYAQSHFPGESAIAGKVVELDGEKALIAGVLPENFQFPFGKFHILTPLALKTAERADRQTRWLWAVGRLRPGVTLAAGLQSLQSTARALEASYPATNTNSGIRAVTLADEIGRHQGNEVVVAVFVITILVLLVICSNIASLMLAKSVERQKEVAVRFAMGASRARVIRQFLAEHALIFLAGAAGSIAVAKGLTSWITNNIPYENRVYLRDFAVIPVDWRAMVFAFLIAISFGIVFGLAPALEGSRLDLTAVIKEGASRGSHSRWGRRIRDGLVVMEIAMATVLLICTVLMGRSLAAIFTEDLGFHPAGVLTANVSLPAKNYPQLARAEHTMEAIHEKIRSLPGVQAVGVVEHVPFGDTGATRMFWIDGRPEPLPAEVPSARYTSISPGYLATMGIPLLAGRDIASADDENSSRVVVINDVFAQRHWPNESPLGRYIRLGARDAEPARIVGVVKSIRMWNWESKPENQMYVPMRQAPARRAYFVVRGNVEGSALQAQVWAVDGAIAAPEIASLQHRVNASFAPHRMTTEMVSLFSLLTLVLAATGLYAMMAWSVTQRAREIGIRMALGAAAWDIVAGVLRRGVVLTAIGAALGLAGAAMTMQSLAIILYKVTSRDPATYLSVAALLAAVSLAACYLPARRASLMDPASALRHD